jgi:hypothetical protein
MVKGRLTAASGCGERENKWDISRERLAELGTGKLMRPYENGLR